MSEEVEQTRLLETFLGPEMETDPESWVDAVDNQAKAVFHQIERYEPRSALIAFERVVLSTTTLLFSQRMLDEDGPTASRLGWVQKVMLMGYEIGKHEEIEPYVEYISRRLLLFQLFDPTLQESEEGIEMAMDTASGLLHIGADFRGFHDLKNVGILRFTGLDG